MRRECRVLSAKQTARGTFRTAVVCGAEQHPGTLGRTLSVALGEWDLDAGNTDSAATWRRPERTLVQKNLQKVLDTGIKVQKDLQLGG